MWCGCSPRWATVPATLRAQRSRVPAGESVVEKAIARLREHFGTRDSRGPELYAQMFPNQPVVERRILQRHAHTTVSEFLKVWDSERR